MNQTRVVTALFSCCVVAAAASAQQPDVTINGDDVTLTGCIVPRAQTTVSPQTLIWTRSDIMLAGMAAARAPVNPIGTRGVSGRVFYWLNDDEDLQTHIGQRVEIKGQLEDFEQGEIEVTRDGAFTEVQLDIDGHKEKARVPTSWFGAAPDEAEFKIVARQVDVDDIRVLGRCGR